MTEPTDRNAGYDEWLDAVAADDAYFLECGEGHGSLPPRRACPVCGSTALEQRSLPATGTIVSSTTVHVTTPQFEDEAPYVTAIAEFGPARLTGLLEAGDDAVEIGDVVLPTVRETDEDGRRLWFEVVS